MTTGVPGSVANVTDSGTAPNHILNFAIPAGAAGAVGPAGKDAINPVFAIGTVKSATAPSVTIGGTAPNYTLSFELPKGDAGQDGTGITIKGTANGGSWPPAGTHASGDLWIIGTPIPTGAPSGAAVGHGFIYDGTNWSDIGPIQGPQGPAGPSAVSTDAGNAARLGADSLIYVPTVTAPTASSTAPLSLAATAAVGTSGDYARADHVHPLPTAALVGAAPVTHTHTSAQVTGLATVATTGKYDDLLNKPTAYTLPTASAVTLGGVKIGTGITIDANGVISSSGGSGGSVSIATDTTAGIVKVGSGLSITPLGTLSVTFPTASTTQQGVVTLADAAAVTAG
ncbi:MAG: hypothetical protein EBS89_15035, partial [Proteobacteria bacterium]|nr:hypothetical protein [Pseudomonadota bacterium]